MNLPSFVVPVCIAFDLCITLMDIGEVCQVVTEARFAYGAIGRSDSTRLGIRGVSRNSLYKCMILPYLLTFTLFMCCVYIMLTSSVL